MSDGTGMRSRAVVMYSGGIGSWAAAKTVIDEYQLVTLDLFDVGGCGCFTQEES